MTDDQVKMLTDAIKDLAKSIREVGSSIAEDEPLNFTIGRGIDKISEAISLRAVDGNFHEKDFTAR